MSGMLQIADGKLWGGFAGPLFRWFFGQLAMDSDDPRVLALCRELADDPFDYGGDITSWDSAALASLAATVERFRDRLRDHGAELLDPGEKVEPWVRIADELLAALRADPRLRGLGPG